MAFTSTTLGFLNRIFVEAGINDWQERAKRHDISNIALYNRIRGGMNPEYACTTPVRQRKRRLINKIFRRWIVRNHKITIVDEPVSFMWEEPVF